jgi:hypothetical protein
MNSLHSKTLDCSAPQVLAKNRMQVIEARLHKKVNVEQTFREQRHLAKQHLENSNIEKIATSRESDI